MRLFLAGVWFVWLYMFSGGVSKVSACAIKPIKYDSIPHSGGYYKIFTNSDRSYGYDIYVNGRLLVHQPFIPALQGVKGFKRKTDAQKTAWLVLRKVKEGLIPPVVVQRELDSLRIKY